MRSLEKLNTVDGNNQVNKNVFFEGGTDGSPRIMFVGNSITYHEPKPDIGWYGSWGMAASEKEKDYVHRVISKIRQLYSDAVFCIVQGSVWETNYTNCNYDKYFSRAKGFSPDILISSVSANISDESFENKTFKENLKKLHKYLSTDNTRIFQLSAFFGNPNKNKAIAEYCKEEKAHLVMISDILQNEENRALDKFEHEGVQIHPGDIGMQLIAERIFDSLIKFSE